MLAVRVVEISTDDAASCNGHIVLGVGVKEDRVVDLAAETNRMIELNQLSILGGGLSVDLRSLRGWYRLLFLLWWELL